MAVQCTHCSDSNVFQQKSIINYKSGLLTNMNTTTYCFRGGEELYTFNVKGAIRLH